MVVALLPGLRFQGTQVLSSLNKLNIETDVYSSSQLKQWSNLYRKNYNLVPMPFAILQRKMGLMRRTWMKEFDANLFDRVSLYKGAKKADVIHGWATFSLFSGQTVKKNGGAYFLERACPHIDFQNELLHNEADTLGMKLNYSSNEFNDRAREEYEVCDKIILPSDYSLQSFIDRGFPKSKLIKAPLNSNFIPKYTATAKNKTSEAPFIVGFVGGNFLRKGVAYLITAWQNLKLHNAILKLKISINELTRIPEYFNKINSDPSIEITGYVDDIEDFYKDCDVFCLPSIDDGFGMVVFEALACGVPVIVSENAGASELLINKTCGNVVEARNPNQLSESILKYYDNREHLVQAKQEAIMFYKKFTKTDRHFAAMKDLYKDYLDETQ